MIKKAIIIMISVVAVGFTLAVPVFAQDAGSQPSVETPADRLINNCITIQPSLRRLHTYDALLRVNTSQIYNEISVRLMARLNSRLAINRIDSTKLVEIAGRLEVERVQFAEDYNQYDVALSSLIKKGCKVNSVELYDALIVSRDKRNQLAETVKRLNLIVGEYRVAVEQLKQDLFTVNQKEQDAVDRPV